jgi:adenylate kinase family enzyme
MVKVNIFVKQAPLKSSLMLVTSHGQTIEIKKIRHREQDYLGIFFPYDAEMIQRVKSLPDRQYSSTLKCWYLPYSLVIINVLFAIFSLIGFQLPIVSKIFGIISLVASILILVYESQENKSTIKRHMSMGDEYLDIHYQLQELFFKDKFEDDDFDDVKERIQKLNKKDKPIINQIAKWQAKSAIEKKGEMTKWWK